MTSGLDIKVKFLKRSLIVNLLKHELSTASLQSSTGKVILNHINYSTDVTSIFNRYESLQRFLVGL